MTTADLPAVNAVLNSMCAILLGAGFYFIKRRNVVRHTQCMLGAVVVSGVFLVSYVVYHALHGSTKFTHEGATLRSVYFFILITHVVLAAANVPMVLITLYRAIKGQFEKHKRIAPWTLAIWMYVSVTGVVVYLMLYQLFPAA